MYERRFLRDVLVLLLQDGGTDCFNLYELRILPTVCACVSFGFHNKWWLFVFNSLSLWSSCFLWNGNQILKHFRHLSQFPSLQSGPKEYLCLWKLLREIGQSDKMYGWRHRLFFLCGLISSVVFPQSILEVTSPHYLCCVCERYCRSIRVIAWKTARCFGMGKLSCTCK